MANASEVSRLRLEGNKVEDEGEEEFTEGKQVNLIMFLGIAESKSRGYESTGLEPLLIRSQEPGLRYP